MLETAFTELVGCRLPIQLAAMGGGVTTPELVVAVSRAGGLGMLQRGGTRPLAERIAEIEDARAGPFGVNFVPALGQGERDEIELAASRARLVEFFWADPDPEVVALVHAGGALAGWQVGSVDEARRAADAGCDLVVAQGVEAGGHVRGTVALLPLLAEVLEAVSVPVVAAGGIASARSMAAVLAAGASAVRIGTRFLATSESGAHPDYVAALLASGQTDTVLTTAFGVGWPDAPHRVLASAVAAAEALDDETVGALDVNGEPQPLPRLAARTPTREVTGTVEAMALYAGEGVGLVTEIEDAGSLVRELAEGAEALLRRWA
ncbi:MAG TPA: nitronate monooxygenase [Gaiellaceae bacterium]|jgi:NAD(P)H-dependent flavin oxidoreductase YrpB (nitropropane dioxygenase family)